MPIPILQQGSRWCVVVADDHGPEWAPLAQEGERARPVQYCRLGASSTLLQRALQRASRLTTASHILVTANEHYRPLWEPAFWFLRPEQRFIGNTREDSVLTTAGALLSIAERHPTDIVTILPAKCYVAYEWVLSAAIDRAVEALPSLSEGMVTLGMVDLEEGIDEDYLITRCAEPLPNLIIHSVIHRPTAWIARHLHRQGAMVVSNIRIGYASAFAGYIWRQCPELAARLVALAGIRHALRWNSPTLRQRVRGVYRCGWSGLQSSRAVARLSAFATAASLGDCGEADSAIGAEENESKMFDDAETARRF